MFAAHCIGVALWMLILSGFGDTTSRIDAPDPSRWPLLFSCAFGLVSIATLLLMAGN